jgi:hypothetical protein
MMKPYVGSRYGDRTTKLLLIGESHYLPDGATQGETPADWYDGTSATLSQEEIRWINTAAIVEGAVKSNFPKKPHWIWKNAFKEINAAGPRYPDYKRVADDVAFYNFFLRPAMRGLSLACEPRDVAMANDAFMLHCGDLKPSAVVFLSVLAHSHFHAPPGVKVIATTHPSSAWWNRESRARGGKSGRQILSEYIATTVWP